jgi:hypothetical protein
MREVVVPGFAGRRSDRLDLLLQSAGRSTAAIEVKLLSDLGPQQLQPLGDRIKSLRIASLSRDEHADHREHGGEI